MSRFKRIGLFNPAMRELKTLPPHPVHDYSEIYTLIGFGLDPFSGNFKLVVIEPSEYQNFAYVYNLSGDSWKRIEIVSDLFGYPDTSDNSRILNGFKHWLVKYYNRDYASILAFNMRSEKFQDIPIPSALRTTKSYLHLTEHCDSLAVASFKWDVFLDLWVMGGDGLWSKSFSINGPFQELVWPLCLWDDNKVVFGASSSPLIVDKGPQRYFVCKDFTYKESLVSIKGEGDQADSIEDLYSCD